MGSVPASTLLTVDPAQVLGVHQQGRFDPTTRLEPGNFWRASLTPDGPGTLHLSWSQGSIVAEAWGSGAQWLLAHVPALLGDHDEVPGITPAHPAVARALHNHPRLRLGHCRDLYHTMLPIIIGQRVTAREAYRSWSQLCRAAGRSAPGPVRLTLPPEPEAISHQPYWWFHRFGIERKRADALRVLAQRADLLASLSRGGDAVEARAKLSLLAGIGQWTIGSSLGPALGDPDAFAVGDFWLCHLVGKALEGTFRSSDERMVELLAPYAGQRGRVVALIGADGWSIERRGPGIRVLPIAQL